MLSTPHQISLWLLLWFPNSVWERPFAKLCFVAGNETEFLAETFPNRVWERGEALRAKTLSAQRRRSSSWRLFAYLAPLLATFSFIAATSPNRRRTPDTSWPRSPGS